MGMLRMWKKGQAYVCACLDGRYYWRAGGQVFVNDIVLGKARYKTSTTPDFGLGWNLGVSIFCNVPNQDIYMYI